MKKQHIKCDNVQSIPCISVWVERNQYFEFWETNHMRTPQKKQTTNQNLATKKKKKKQNEE